MISYILTAFGSDQPGIVSALSGLIKQNGGNIEISKMTKMGDQFVMTLLITLTKTESDNIISKIKNNNILNIQIHPTVKLENKKSTYSKKIKLSGADNEGIVHSLTKKLARNNINIIDLDTFINMAPISATPLFNLNATIEIPQKLSKKSLKEIIDQHSTKLGVNINLQD